MIIEEALNNKNILFFSVQTFNLEKEIIKKLEFLGANVEYYDERPSNSNLTKGIIRLKRSLLQLKINKYYNKILSDISDKKYDFLFVNKGEVVPAFFLEKFQEVQPHCQFIFYTWDSFSNNKNALNILKYFHKKFSFDSDDAVKYGLEFRPLFYLDFYKDIDSISSVEIKNDLLFLGTAHSDRYKISNSIADWCERNQLKSYCYYYMQGRLVYFYKKLFDRTFKEFDYKKLSFASLKGEDLFKLYQKSKVVLDINHPGQKGLTMRTFETIGAKRKMITTNTEVRKYKFYNPNNILIIDRENIKLNKEFFESDYNEVDKDLYEKMSLKGWLSCLFINSEPNIWIEGIE
ncbi:hypothetical protein C8C83_2616 [Flavobacterium sp. 90]|uniref:lipopolysaccharide biosynthesis protein n=1 Tax=unclassified Flavobacterium TaxID=196869 RepID=UPI000EADC932|nr:MULTISPECIES: lipopolysaccharide biosynthesis protein [unclassified Flavobacterium]RKR10922.1 hypothetical protein C8C82_2922 [Flavobacterium sp. 81]TCK54706.1 hypothetical protein C8C83_2616 [Flavobacterium sp. 90]